MNNVRKFWLDSMLKIADPVFQNLANGTLHSKLPSREHDNDSHFDSGMLEAFARTFCGFAPFINNFYRSEEEENIAEKYRKLITKCLDNATCPSSPDYMNFGQTGEPQPLVDAAFLAHGLIRSGEYVASLSAELKKQIIDALVISRDITPYPNNWILFSCMVEAGIHRLGGKYDLLRASYGIRQFMQWYTGDGMYGDGDEFHMDYYNSFVIQPMLIDIITEFESVSKEFQDFKPVVMRRAARYAEILERLINKDGTYPYTGRSITYRFGAFQLLSQAVLQHFSTLSSGAVRCGLTEVIRRVMERDIFDENGWLLHGIYGSQPSLAEPYICTGSLYLCSAVFLPLGLPEDDEFWSAPDEKWTSLKITDGEDVKRDHCIVH